jgi:hypothetical protein
MKSIEVLSLIFVGITISASASLPTATRANVTSIAAAPNGGFWVQVDESSVGTDAGKTLAIDGAPVFENVPAQGSIASISTRNGYWVVAPKGQIFARGDASELCGGSLRNCSGFPSSVNNYNMIVAAAADPNGKGLWALGADGKVWTAGNVVSYGDVQNDPSTPTGIAVTPYGRGYYIVMSDGGVFSFGDAVFHGSTGGKKPGGRKITGIALNLVAVRDSTGTRLETTVNGYWLVAEDGGVFSFGSAPFWGSTGGNSPLNVTSIASFSGPQIGGSPQLTRCYAWVSKFGEVGVGRRK